MAPKKSDLLQKLARADALGFVDKLYSKDATGAQPPTLPCIRWWGQFTAQLPEPFTLPHGGEGLLIGSSPQEAGQKVDALRAAIFARWEGTREWAGPNWYRWMLPESEGWAQTTLVFEKTPTRLTPERRLFVNPDTVPVLITRLLEGPLLLASSGANVWRAERSVQGSAAHREAFAEYTRELLIVTEAALDSWLDTVDRCIREKEDETAGRRQALIASPAGPANHAGLIALIRDFWFRCDQINQTVPAPERVPPWIFLLGWLQGRPEFEEAAAVLASLWFWPIGLDDAGKWI